MSNTAMFKVKHNVTRRWFVWGKGFVGYSSKEATAISTNQVAAIKYTYNVTEETTITLFEIDNHPVFKVGTSVYSLACDGAKLYGRVKSTLGEQITLDGCSNPYTMDSCFLFLDPVQAKA